MPSETEQALLAKIETLSNQIAVRPPTELSVEPSGAAAMRYQKLLGFVRDNFEFGVHFDVAPGQRTKDRDGRERAPADLLADPKITKCMNQPGAEMVLAAWCLHPEFTIIEKEQSPTFYYYLIRCDVKDQNGTLHGSALAMASSDETKYKYRWMFRNEITNDPVLSQTIDIDMCPTKKFGDYTKYRIINPEPGDLAPTLIMMAQKRGMVKVARTIFGISAIFQQPLEDLIAAMEARMDMKAETSGENKRSNPPQPSGQQKTSRAVGALRKLFDDHCKAHDLKGKDKQDKQAQMFADCMIVGWKDVISADIENAVQAWIDERLPLPENHAEQGNLMG